MTKHAVNKGAIAVNSPALNFRPIGRLGQSVLLICAILTLGGCRDRSDQQLSGEEVEESLDPATRAYIAGDYSEAAHLYELAAVQGDAEAQTALAGMYQEGQGVSQDSVIAYMWLSVAARSDPIAETFLRASEVTITSEQIAVAQSLASWCIASDYQECGTPAQEFPIAATISGTGGIKDGDGLLFGQVEIRLLGIAAPEDSQSRVDPGGPEATQNLTRLADGRSVTCDLDGTLAGSGRRPVGICYVDGRDLGRLQVHQGYARDCPAFSHGRYAQAEQEAISNGIELRAIYELPDYCLVDAHDR